MPCCWKVHNNRVTTIRSAVCCLQHVTTVSVNDRPLGWSRLTEKSSLLSFGPYKFSTPPSYRYPALQTPIHLVGSTKILYVLKVHSTAPTSWCWQQPSWQQTSTCAPKSQKWGVASFRPSVYPRNCIKLLFVTEFVRSVPGIRGTTRRMGKISCLGSTESLCIRWLPLR